MFGVKWEKEKGEVLCAQKKKSVEFKSTYYDLKKIEEV